jgi:hypothetical protein
MGGACGTWRIESQRPPQEIARTSAASGHQFALSVVGTQFTLREILGAPPHPGGRITTEIAGIQGPGPTHGRKGEGGAIEVAPRPRSGTRLLAHGQHRGRVGKHGPDPFIPAIVDGGESAPQPMIFDPRMYWVVENTNGG